MSNGEKIKSKAAAKKRKTKVERREQRQIEQDAKDRIEEFDHPLKSPPEERLTIHPRMK